MEINNNALNIFINQIITMQECVAFDYEASNDSVIIQACATDYKDLPYNLKIQTSFAETEISKQEFEQITGIKI